MAIFYSSLINNFHDMIENKEYNVDLIEKFINIMDEPNFSIKIFSEKLQPINILKRETIMAHYPVPIVSALITHGIIGDLEEDDISFIMLHRSYDDIVYFFNNFTTNINMDGLWEVRPFFARDTYRALQYLFNIHCLSFDEFIMFFPKVKNNIIYIPILSPCYICKDGHGFGIMMDDKFYHQECFGGKCDIDFLINYKS